MSDVYITGGSGAGAVPPAELAGNQSGGPADPLMTVEFDKTVTALVQQTINENLREVARWMVPGAFRPGRLVAGTNKIRSIYYGDLDRQDSLIAVEGVPPDEEPLSIGWHEYSVRQRGRLVGISDVSLSLSPHELMAVAAERVGYDALMTVDKSIADNVIAAAASGVTAPTITTALDAANIREWVTRMKTAFVPTFPDGYYVMMAHPAVVFDIQSDTAIGGWIEASKYAQPDRLLTGEVGRIYGVRVVETTVGTVNALATDTYNTVMFGPDYFAYGDLQSVESYMVRPGGDHGDPLAQKGLVGYKGMWGSEVLLDEATTPVNGGGPKFSVASGHAGTLDLTA